MNRRLFSLGLLLPLALLQGCSTLPPYPDLSHFHKPSPGKAGVFFYQWKTGFLGSAYDVKFILDGKEMAQLNTGEWTYFEIEPGVHEVAGQWRLTKTPYEFKADHVYLFQGQVANFQAHVFRPFLQQEQEDAMKNIRMGWYAWRPQPGRHETRPKL